MISALIIDEIKAIQMLISLMALIWKNAEKEIKFIVVWLKEGRFDVFKQKINNMKKVKVESVGIARKELIDMETLLQVDIEYSSRRSDILLNALSVGAIYLIFQFVKEYGLENLSTLKILVLSLSGCGFVLSILTNFFALRLHKGKSEGMKNLIKKYLHSPSEQSTVFIKPESYKEDKVTIKALNKASRLLYITSVILMTTSLIILTVLIVVIFNTV